MLYLKEFSLPGNEAEGLYFVSGDIKTHMTCYDSVYPFGVFHYRDVPKIEFEPVTIFYGGNGSGKSTLLNVMAEALELKRGAPFNRTDFFDDYVSLCKHSSLSIPKGSRIICSDDVFDYMLDLRTVNQGIDTQRKELRRDYHTLRQTGRRLESLEDYEYWKSHTDAWDRKPSVSKYVRRNLMDNVRTRSNGESALKFFTESIRENALYILDEPENSLSPAMQLELKKFLEDSARFYGCQLVISTHSPFLLSMTGARVYDLDSDPVAVRNWTELPNVRVYRDFFRDHEREF